MVLDAEDKYSFNEDGSEMTILEVAKLDEGEYTCIARNKAGESDQELSLRVFGKEPDTLPCAGAGTQAESPPCQSAHRCNWFM